MGRRVIKFLAAPITTCLVAAAMEDLIHACAATDKDRLGLTRRIPLGAVDALRATKVTAKRVALVQVAEQAPTKIPIHIPVHRAKLVLLRVVLVVNM